MKNKVLMELLEEVRECDHQIENLEKCREELYKRIDKELEDEENGIISLNNK